MSAGLPADTPLTCARCGASNLSVAVISYSAAGEARSEPLCGLCKTTLLERRRVRAHSRRRRRSNPQLRLVGRGLVALGAVVLALALLAGVVDAVTGGDDGGDPCQAAAARSGCRSD